MPVSELHHVSVSVRDLERSVGFYRDVLGFETVLEFDLDDPARTRRMLHTPAHTGGRSVILRKPRSQVGEVELIQFDPPAEAPVGPLRAGDPGAFLLAFEVSGEDLADVHARLEAAGVVCHGPPESVEIENYGQLRSLVFRDPDGLMIEFVSLPDPADVRRRRGTQPSA